MKVFTSLAEINLLSEWAVAQGWEIDPIPPAAEYQVLRLRKDNVLAIFYRSDKRRFNTSGPGVDLLRAYRASPPF